MTEIKNEELMKEASGGTGRKAELKKALADIVGADVMKKLENVYSNVDVCRILAENGVDLDAVEKKIADAGLDMKRIGLQLPDDRLSEISSGFWEEDMKADLECPVCHRDDRKNFSRQFWVSLIAPNTKSIYRCKKCDLYIAVNEDKDDISYNYDLDYLLTHL